MFVCYDYELFAIVLIPSVSSYVALISSVLLYCLACVLSFLHYCRNVFVMSVLLLTIGFGQARRHLEYGMLLYISYCYCIRILT